MSVRCESRNLIRVTSFEGKLVYFRIYDHSRCLLMDLFMDTLFSSASSASSSSCVTSQDQVTLCLPHFVQLLSREPLQAFTFSTRLHFGDRPCTVLRKWGTTKTTQIQTTALQETIKSSYSLLYTTIEVFCSLSCFCIVNNRVLEPKM